MLTILFAFIVTLGIVIVVHELGHFAVCKWTGIYVKTFSIGFGPKLLRVRWGETEYALSLIPFGGYVKMAGEGVLEEIQDTGTGSSLHYPVGTEQGNREAAARDGEIPPDRHFRNRPPWQRLAVLAAGPVANLVLAAVLYTAVTWHQGMPIIPTTRLGDVAAGSPAAAAGLAVGDSIVAVAGTAVSDWNQLLAALERGLAASPRVPLSVVRGDSTWSTVLVPRREGERWRIGWDPLDTRIGLVQRDGPADRAGLRSGDRILALDGRPVTSFRQIAEVINRSAGRPVRVRWRHDGQVLEREIVPEADEIQPDSTVGRIFIDRYYASRSLSPLEAARVGLSLTWASCREILRALAAVFTSRQGLASMGGPIRIGQMAGQMLRWSIDYFLRFIAFLSVNLFLLNLMPIPVLDGGHIVFVLWEMITGRRVRERIQAIATQVGLIALLVLMTVLIVRDLLHALPG